MAPPSTPIRYVLGLPLKYSFIFTGIPSTRWLIKNGLMKKVLTNMPIAKTTPPEYGVSVPLPSDTNDGSSELTPKDQRMQ